MAANEADSMIDLWLPLSDGEGWALGTVKSEDAPRFVITWMDGLWLLCDKRGGWFGGQPEWTPLWASKSSDECQEIGKTILLSEEEVRAFWGKERTEIKRVSEAVPGLRVRINDRKIEAINSTGKNVCNFHVIISGWYARYVLGEMSINCSSSVDKEYCYKGLGREIHDLIEEYYKLPLVPHGRNSVGGSLSKDAQAFWEKRAKHRPVLGVDNEEVAHRQAKVETALRVLRSMRVKDGQVHDKVCELIDDRHMDIAAKIW